MVCESIRLTYAQVHESVDRIARTLLVRGIKPGDRIATLSPPHPDFFLVLLAATSIGAIWVGLNPRYRVGELRQIALDARPKLLFARMRVGERAYDEEVAEMRHSVPELEDVIAMGDDHLRDAGETLGDWIEAGERGPAAELSEARESVDPFDPSLLIYTSGTTGTPKGAVLTQRGVVRHCLTQLSIWQLDEIRTVNSFPTNHLSCVVHHSSCPLVAGGTVVYLEKFDPDQVIEAIESEKVTIWGGVPAMLSSTLDRLPAGKPALRSLQLISCGGSGASGELVEALLRICPRMTTTYALTEAGGLVTAVPPTDDVSSISGSLGWPAPDVELRLADGANREVAEGAIGEIQLRGDFVMTGYWNLPDATAQTIDAEGWLHTGDLGRREADGRLVFSGRIKEMFKSGGYNVYPREVEIAIECHPDVGTAAVVPVADPRFGEVGHAFVSARSGAALSAESLERHCRDRIANYKVPKRFYIVTEFPALPNGKVDKRALASIAASE